LLAGVLGGYEFAVATEVFFADRDAAQTSTGLLYGVDLMGACIGTLVSSAFLLPLFGFFKTALVIALVNLIPAILALSVGLSKAGAIGQPLTESPTPQR
jgi:predicted membrane-bound spermidine synthase